MSVKSFIDSIKFIVKNKVVTNKNRDDKNNVAEEEKVLEVLASKEKGTTSGISIGDGEEGINVILLVLIVVGIIVASLIFVGVIYNCIKRHKRGRHLFTGEQLRKVNEYDDDESDSEEDSTSEYERKSSKDFAEDNNISKVNAKQSTETKVDIEMDAKEGKPLLENTKGLRTKNNLKQENQSDEQQVTNQEISNHLESDIKLIDEEEN